MKIEHARHVMPVFVTTPGSYCIIHGQITWFDQLTEKILLSVQGLSVYQE